MKLLLSLLGLGKRDFRKENKKSNNFLVEVFSATFWRKYFFYYALFNQLYDIVLINHNKTLV